MVKRNSLRGIGTVFQFSVQQHYKAISIRIFLLILFVISLASLPVASIFLTDEVADSSSVTTLYLRNETGIPFLSDTILADERYASLKIVETESSDETFASLLAESQTNMAASIVLDEQKGFAIKGFYSENSSLDELDVNTLTDMIAEAFHQSQMQALSITDEQLDIANAPYSMQVQLISDYNADSDQTDFSVHGMISMFYSMITMFLGTLSMSYIFQLCVDEKNSKLVELLLVSVNPLAILVGKVMAVTVFLTAGIGLILLGLFLSYLITSSMGSVEFIHEMFETIGINHLIDSLNVKTILLLIPSVFLGYATMALLSSIFASCCSKTEDIQTNSLYVALILIVGYIVASFAPMLESESVNLFVSLCPFLSVFTALANYICGKISFAILLLAWAIQIALIVALAIIAGRIYRMMILYRGGVPKLNKLIAMYRAERKQKQEVPHEKA